MDTGKDVGAPAPYGNHVQPLRSPSIEAAEPTAIERPTVVTLIAVCMFVAATAFFIAAGVGLSQWFAPFTDHPTLERYIFASLLASFLFYVAGRAWWKLREWVRLLTIMFLGLSLVAGGPSSDWWIRSLQLALMVYLISPSVRAVFLLASEQNHPKIIDRWFVRRQGIERG